MVDSLQTQSILCVIDFSESSVDVLQWAAGMAVKLNAHVTIVHPYRLKSSGKKEDMVAVKKMLDQDAIKNFNEMAPLPIKDGLVSYDFKSEVGFLSDRVQEHVRKNSILFLVMSVKMALGNKEALSELTEQLEVPLIMVPQSKSIGTS